VNRGARLLVGLDSRQITHAAGAVVWLCATVHAGWRAIGRLVRLPLSESELFALVAASLGASAVGLAPARKKTLPIAFVIAGLYPASVVALCSTAIGLYDLLVVAVGATVGIALVVPFTAVRSLDSSSANSRADWVPGAGIVALLAVDGFGGADSDGALMTASVAGLAWLSGARVATVSFAVLAGVHVSALVGAVSDGARLLFSGAGEGLPLQREVVRALLDAQLRRAPVLVIVHLVAALVVMRLPARAWLGVHILLALGQGALAFALIGMLK
jgi:hypothetical protein